MNPFVMSPKHRRPQMMNKNELHAQVQDMTRPTVTFEMSRRENQGKAVHPQVPQPQPQPQPRQLQLLQSTHGNRQSPVKSSVARLLPHNLLVTPLKDVDPTRLHRLLECLFGEDTLLGDLMPALNPSECSMSRRAATSPTSASRHQTKPTPNALDDAQIVALNANNTQSTVDRVAESAAQTGTPASAPSLRGHSPTAPSRSLGGAHWDASQEGAQAPSNASAIAPAKPLHSHTQGQSAQSSDTRPDIQGDAHQTHLTSAKGAPCAHVQDWKRLRSKRGYTYFACYSCYAKWRVPKCECVDADGLEGTKGTQNVPQSLKADLADDRNVNLHEPGPSLELQTDNMQISYAYSADALDAIRRMTKNSCDVFASGVATAQSMDPLNLHQVEADEDHATAQSYDDLHNILRNIPKSTQNVHNSAEFPASFQSAPDLALFSMSTSKSNLQPTHNMQISSAQSADAFSAISRMTKNSCDVFASGYSTAQSMDPLDLRQLQHQVEADEDHATAQSHDDLHNILRHIPKSTQNVHNSAEFPASFQSAPDLALFSMSTSKSNLQPTHNMQISSAQSADAFSAISRMTKNSCDVFASGYSTAQSMDPLDLHQLQHQVEADEDHATAQSHDDLHNILRHIPKSTQKKVHNSAEFPASFQSTQALALFHAKMSG